MLVGISCGILYLFCWHL